MEQPELELLQQLVEIGAPSGYEQPVQALYSRRTAQLGAETEIDVHGNAYAILNREGAPRVMFAGHADEIGFLVRYIDDDGFIYFGAVGGWDAEVIIGQRVLIHTRSGPLPGVVGKRAIHLMSPEDRKKKSELDSLWIDIGASSGKEAKSLVRSGDPVTIQASLQQLRGDLAVAKSFDNRMAVWICAEIIRLLAPDAGSLRAGVYSVATVQEEIGLRGARTSSIRIAPEVGIALDVGHSTDYPEADKRKVGDLRVGAGPVIARGANINPRVFDLLVEAAEAEKIPYQLEAAPGGTGTDANAMQVSGAGMATGLISVAVRYMHSPCELLSLTDLTNAARLCAAFVRRLEPGMDWTP